MSKKIISLSTKEELSIYMSPQRQQLLRVMRIAGLPMTAKALADKLGISASSAAHHISKLSGLGVVEEDHTEMINGIRARYYRLTDVTVNIGQQLDDGLSGERNAILQNMLQNTLSGLYGGIEAARRTDIPEEDMKNYGDCLGGVVYLKPDDSQKLLELIRNYLDEHETFTEGAHPWEYALILYNAGFKP